MQRSDSGLAAVVEMAPPVELVETSRVHISSGVDTLAERRTRFDEGDRTRRLEDHPEWLVLALAALAWIGFFVSSGSGLAGAHSHEAGATGSSVDPLLTWMLMVIAMMLPSTAPHLRYVGFGVRRAVRQRAVLLFVLGYLTVWTLPGLLLTLLPPVPLPALAVLLLATAAYELTPVKSRALRTCCRTSPVRYSGTAADASAVEYGLRHGWVCLVASGPGMAALMLAGHAWWAVVVGTAVMCGQKLLNESRRWRLPVALGWFAAGVAVLSVAALP